MSLAESMKKLAAGEPLEASERNELARDFRQLENVSSLVSSWLVSGGTTPFIKNLRAENILIPSGEIQLGSDAGSGFSGVRIAYPAFTIGAETWNLAGFENGVLQVGLRASDGKLVFGGGDGWLDDGGLNFVNQEGAIFFEDTLGNQELMTIYSDGVDNLAMRNATGNGGFNFRVDTATHLVADVSFAEDPAMAERVIFGISSAYPGGKGTRLLLEDNVILEGAGEAGGATDIQLGSSPITPSDPNGSDVHIYAKSSKIIFQWLDGGTVRYKYLDLTGTGVTWVHSTTPP